MTRINGILHEHLLCVHSSYLAQICSEWEILQTKLVQETKKNFNIQYSSFFLENGAVYGTLCKNHGTSKRPQMTPPNATTCPLRLRGFPPGCD